MNKKIIALILCAGLIFGNTASVYADETMTSVSEEIVADSLENESSETEIESAATSNGAQVDEESVLDELDEQNLIVDDVQTEQQNGNDEEEIGLIGDVESKGIGIESYSVTLLKPEHGFLQYSEEMILPDKEESSDPSILDARRFEVGTEVRIKALQEEGFETSSVTIDYLESNQQIELIETNGEYVFTLPAEDVVIHATFAQIEAPEEELVDETEEMPMLAIAPDENTSPEGWNYDESTNTLSLTNYNGLSFSEEEIGTAQIFSSGDLNIVLSGDNVLSAETQYGIYCQGNLKISGSGSLTIEGSGIGIYAGQELTINESIIIDQSTSEDGICVHWGDITLDNATVTTEKNINIQKGDADVNDSSISAQEINVSEFVINNSNVSGRINSGDIRFERGLIESEYIHSGCIYLKQGTIRAEYAGYSGLEMNDGLFEANYVNTGSMWTIIDGGKFEVENEDGLAVRSAFSFTINGGEVFIKGKTGFEMCQGALEITDGTVTIIGTEGSGADYLSAGYTSVSGGNVNIEGNTYGLRMNNIRVTGGEVSVYGKTQALSYDDECTISGDFETGYSKQSATHSTEYRGERYIHISFIELKNLRVGTIPDQTYSGIALKPEIEINNGEIALIYGTDYTASYKNNVNAGTATVTITGKGKYSGVVSVDFTIIPKAVTPTVTLGTTKYIYDGNAKKPSVSVKCGDTTMVSGTDYTVVYSSNTVVGKASAKVTLKGNYSGTKTVNYSIVPPAATLSSVANTATGVKVSWTKVASAGGYYIYRTTGSGTATKVATITNNATLTYTDTGAKTNNTKYSYYVVAYKTVDGTTYSSAKSATKFTYFMAKMAAPTLSNTATGVKVTWKQSAGANGYYIYRSTGSGSASKVKTITSGSTLTYTDTGAKTNNTKYTYYVVAYKTVSSTTYKSDNSATKVTYFMSKMAAPTLANVSTGIKVTWKKSTGANGYYIYRKAGSGSYSLVKTITSGSTLTYTDTGAKTNGTKYTYYVVAYKTVSSVKYKSANSAAKVLYFISRPAISSLKSTTAKKMTVAWAKNAKSTGYQIQYGLSSTFASGNKTVTVKDAANLSKVIGSLTSGKTYYVRIRTYKTVSGTNYYSAWSAKKSVRVK